MWVRPIVKIFSLGIFNSLCLEYKYNIFVKRIGVSLDEGFNVETYTGLKSRLKIRKEKGRLEKRRVALSGGVPPLLL